MELTSTDALPCGSVLKPLYAYLSNEYPEKWYDAYSAIICSDNDAADRLVLSVGGVKVLRSKLNTFTGTEDFTSAETWGGFLVTPKVIAHAYECLLARKSASSILGAMKDVKSGQRLGVPLGLKMKAGWDKHVLNGIPVLVTHVVIIDEEDRIHSGMSLQRINEDLASYWDDLVAYGAEFVLPLHDNLIGLEMLAKAKDSPRGVILTKVDLDYTLTLDGYIYKPQGGFIASR